MVIGLESTWVLIAKPIVIFAFVLGIVPIILWIERKLLGRFQSRVGPNRVGFKGLLQPAADVLKLLSKEASTPETAVPWMMAIAPVISIVTAVATLAIIPWGPVGAWGGHRVEAYEIHHGIASVVGDAEPFLDGCRRGQVWGTMWHGSLENDDFRRAWLSGIAVAAGSDWRPEPGAPAYGARRELMVETLADAVDEHVDLELLLAGTRVSLEVRR